MTLGCATEGCGKVKKVRGLCGECYKRRLAEVNAGRISWEKLEAEGRAKPPSPRRWTPIRMGRR